MKKDLKIVCPVCGAEYLPAEIYEPMAFFGRPRYIEKDKLTSKISTFSGMSMDPSEHYICDHCNTPLKIFAKVQFIVSEDKNFNFNKEHSTSLKTNNNLFLSED